MHLQKQFNISMYLRDHATCFIPSCPIIPVIHIYFSVLALHHMKCIFKMNKIRRSNYQQYTKFGNRFRQYASYRHQCKNTLQQRRLQCFQLAILHLHCGRREVFDSLPFFLVDLTLWSFRRFSVRVFLQPRISLVCFFHQITPISISDWSLFYQICYVTKSPSDCNCSATINSTTYQRTLLFS